MRDAQVQILLLIPAFSGVYPTMRSKNLSTGGTGGEIFAERQLQDFPGGL